MSSLPKTDLIKETVHGGLTEVCVITMNQIRPQSFVMVFCLEGAKQV